LGAGGSAERPTVTAVNPAMKREEDELQSELLRAQLVLSADRTLKGLGKSSVERMDQDQFVSEMLRVLPVETTTAMGNFSVEQCLFSRAAATTSAASAGPQGSDIQREPGGKQGDSSALPHVTPELWESPSMTSEHEEADPTDHDREGGSPKRMLTLTRMPLFQKVSVKQVCSQLYL
jgi:hypothetical protein